MSAVGIKTSKRKKTRASFKIENQYKRRGYKFIAGLDEVGRGAWAGPLVAAAAILPADLKIGSMFESKALNPIQRAEINNYLRVSAISYGIGEASVAEINELGLTGALLLCYERALRQLDPQPDLVLLDGLRMKSLKYKHEAIVKGDDKCKSIAAASVIAKEYRDAQMTRLSPRFPEYAFHLNKGYGTKHHQAALKSHGVLPIHRINYSSVAKVVADTKTIVE